MARNLTTRQEAILQFILEYARQEGFPPSIREIGKEFNIGSLRGVTVHLDALERKGYIQRGVTPRSIRVIHPDYDTGKRVAMVPLVGEIAAGSPILAQENIETLFPVPQEMVRSIDKPFLLRIRGDSMINEHIMPRDLVLIKPQETANSGDLAAVRIDDEATVKRVFFEPNAVRLVPANPAYNPIVVEGESLERFHIIGKVVGLMRDYEGMSF